MSIPAAVLTISDSTHRGEREDLSGPAIISLLQQKGLALSPEMYCLTSKRISATLIQMSEMAQFIVTNRRNRFVAPRCHSRSNRRSFAIGRYPESPS